jgi:hypothetical protein
MTRGYIGILFGVIAALAIQQDDRGVAFIRKVPTSLWAGLMVVGYFVATGTDNLYLNLLISLPAALFIAALINREKDFYQMVLSFPILVWLGKLTYVIYLIHRLFRNIFEQLSETWTTSRLCDVVCYDLRCVDSCSVVSTRHCRATADKIWPRDGWQAPQYPRQRGHRACLVSGIVHVRKTRCRWRDCPAVYGPSTTLLSSGQYWAPIAGKVRRSIDSLQA